MFGILEERAIPLTDQNKFVVGVDGGGTKTNVLLVSMDGTVAAESTGGPSHLQSVGCKQSAFVIFNLIKECADKTQIDPSAIQSVVIGLAGAGRSSDRNELAASLQGLAIKKKFPLKNITIETDARIGLEAALAGNPGVVVIAGTGSIALYRTEDHKLLRAGGWGKVIGDEGSGFSVGRDGLNAVMRQYDGRGEKTLLTQKAFQHFTVDSTDDLITKIYHDHVDVASFAPKVFEAVVERDRPAHLILVKNSGELIELIRVLLMKSPPRKKLPIVLMGGVLESENVYSKMVKDRILSSLPHVVIQKPKFPAAFGAAIIALNAFR